LAGVTRHPNQEWMEQMARNVTMEDSGFLINHRYLLHDRDSKYCSSFRQVIEAGNVKTLALPPRSPNLNAYAERWVRSVKEECLAKLILLGEGSLRRALRHYEAHYHEERNHQPTSHACPSPNAEPSECHPCNMFYKRVMMRFLVASYYLLVIPLGCHSQLLTQLVDPNLDRRRIGAR
jgi:hypothetical protein